MCTCNFHGGDVGLVRSIRSSALASEVFEVAKQLDHCFGVHEGAVLYRSAADYLDEVRVAVRRPGGTRKAIALDGAPGSIIEQYRVVVGALWGRLHWKLQGHGARSIASLLEIGRLIQNPHFCSIMFFHDILRYAFRPYSLQVERALDAVAIKRGRARLKMRLRRGEKTLDLFNTVVLVTVLCAQHAQIEDLRNFLRAWFHGAARRSFPTFCEHAVDLSSWERFQSLGQASRNARSRCPQMWTQLTL